MAAIKRWLDRALGKLTPAPALRRRGSKWFAERRNWRGIPTMYSRDIRSDEWEDDSTAGDARGGWLQRGSAARRKRNFRI